MTKSEGRELETIRKYLALGMADTAARALSALVRATRSRKTSAQLMELAVDWNLLHRPEFIV